MVNYIFVVFLFLFVIGLVSASVSVGNASHSFEKSYAKGAALKGWINVSFSQELVDSLIKALDKNITLKDLLDKNSIDCRFSSKCSCSPTDCSEGYTAIGNSSSSKSFTVPVLSSKIVGVKLTGNVSHILDFTFNVSTNAASSCLPPFIIDVLADNSVEWTAIATNTNTCYIAKPYGCFESDKVIGNVTINTVPLCGKINVPQAHGFRVGAKIFGVGQTDFRMSLDVGGFQKTCSFTTTGGGEKYCTIVLDDSVSNNAQATVCISALQQTNYTLNFEDNATCGFTESFNHDFEIFAKPLMYNGVSAIGFDQHLLDDDTNMSSTIMHYIEEHYEGVCDPECIIPIKFYSGIDQQFTLFNVNLKYKRDGLEKEPITSFYEVGKKNASISSEFLKLELEKALFSVPSTYGDKVVTLTVGDKSLKGNISVVNTPTIADIVPKTASLLIPTDFIAILDNYSSNTSYSFVWNFGDNSSVMTSSESRMQHTFSKVGNYTLKVTASSNAGNSTKSVVVNVAVLYEAINETIQAYKKDLTTLENGIATLPVWVQEKTAEKSFIENLKTGLARIETNYKETFRSEEDELIKIMNDLTSLKIPVSFNATQSIKPIELIQSSEVYDPAVLEEMGAGTADADAATMYEATNEWNREHVSLHIESSSFSYFYDEGEEVLFSQVKLTIQPQDTIEELYIVVDGKVDEIAFREDYGEKELAEGYGIHLNELTPETTKTIEFIYPGVIDVSHLPVYVSPAFNDLDFGAEPGACNYNDMCEADEGEDYTNCRADCKPWFLTTVFLIILLVIAFVCYIILQEWYKRHYEAYLFKNSNQLFNVISFMNNAENQKMSKEDIFKKLRDYKWNNEQLIYAWNKLHGKRTGMWEIPLFRRWEQSRMQKELEKRKGGKIF
ncbi:MAG: hypothetical protein RL557_128 [archaeon]